MTLSAQMRPYSYTYYAPHRDGVLQREPGIGFPGEFGPDLRSDSGFVELFLVGEMSLLLLLSFLFLGMLPLPFVDTVGKVLGPPPIERAKRKE